AGEHAGPDDVARFAAEAEAVAAFQHPGVVQVYEVGWRHGLPYMALEYVPGGSLADRLRTGALACRAAARLAEQLALALNAAHQAGIVHRDLKPANVLLAACGLAPDAKPQTADCAPKITDFGLAKRLANPASPAAGTLTPTWAVLGTPAYMAPEQASGS